MGEPAGGGFSMFEHRTVAALYFLFGIAGIIGNLLIILVFIGGKPLSGNRGKVHIQLALSNMMVVAGCPFSGSSAFAGTWLYGDIGCQLYGFETYTGGMGAVTFAFLLCVQRFFCTKYPDYYNTSSLSTTLSGLGWLYCLCISIGPLVGWNSYVTESSGTACGLNWNQDDWAHRSMFIALPVITIIQLAIAAYCLKVAFCETAPESKNEASVDDWFTDRQLNWISVSSLAIVSIGFGPYGFFSIWSLFNHSSQMTMVAAVIPPLAAKMSCAFYPIPYLVASRKFRTEYAGKVLGNCACKRD